MNFQELAPCFEGQFDHFSDKYQGVIVCCSGGVDSTVLFNAICHFSKPKKNFLIRLFHMNFGLRGNDSEEDESFCCSLAAAHAVPAEIVKIAAQVRETRSGESVQAWARRLRYEELAKYSEKGWIIALGHHENDLAENVLLRAARGSSPANLAGMQVFDGRLWRPLLHTAKSQLLQIAAANNLIFRHDASNDKIEYSRNLIRHTVLPALESVFPGSSHRIARLGVECAELANALRNNSNAGTAAIPVERLQDTKGLRIRTWVPLLRTYPDVVVRDWVQMGVAEIASGGQTGLSRAFLDELLLVLKNEQKVSSWAREIAGGVRAKIANGFLYIEKSPKNPVHPTV